MKQAATICILLLLFAGAGECRNLILRPSIFETYGGYTDSRHSLEHAGYVTLAVKERQFFTVGFSDLTVSHPQWTYHQQMPTAGALLSHWPLRAKAYYGRIEGKFTSDLYPAYSDHGNVASVEGMYGGYWYDLGVSYAHFRGNGQGYSISPQDRAARQTADQFTGRVTCAITPRFSVTARHNYVHVEDGRNLYSLAMKAVYAPSPGWIVTAGGFIGERAFYFDNDLLVIFNQNDTQRGMIFGQLETRVWKGLSVTGEYIYTHFEYVPIGGIPGADYSIRYLVAGIKGRFPW